MKRDDIITCLRKIGRTCPWIILLLCWGCAPVGSDYVKPDINTSSAWHAPLAGEMTAGQAEGTSLVRWWFIAITDGALQPGQALIVEALGERS